MLLNRLMCIAGRHSVDRHKVRHDGYDFIGKCKHCGTPLVRNGRKDWIVSQSALNETKR